MKTSSSTYLQLNNLILIQGGPPTFNHEEVLSDLETKSKIY